MYFLFVYFFIYLFSFFTYIFLCEKGIMNIIKSQKLSVHLNALQTRLYSFRFDWRMVSLTAANTNRIFSVSKGRERRKD